MTSFSFKRRQARSQDGDPVVWTTGGAVAAQGTSALLAVAKVAAEVVVKVTSDQKGVLRLLIVDLRVNSTIHHHASATATDPARLVRPLLTISLDMLSC